MMTNPQALYLAPRQAEAGTAWPGTRGYRAPAASPTAPELQIAICSDPEQLAGLAPEWDALFARAGRPSQVFQTHAFAAHFANTSAPPAQSASAPDNSTNKLAILTVHRAGRLVLVWPMLESRQLGLRCLSWLGEPITQYGDVVVDPAEKPLPLLRAAYHHILSTLRPDVMRLRKVRTDAAIQPLLQHLAVASLDAAVAPCVTLAAGGSAFEDRQSGKASKNRRRLMRRLAERGRVEFAELKAGDDAAAVVAEAFGQKRRWLVRRGLLSPALASQQVDRFFTKALRDPQRPTGCAVFALKLDGRPIAVALGFRCKRRLMLHLITYAEDVEKLGAGVLNLEAILRLAEAEGLEAVDLLPPKADYKLDWADTSVSVADNIWGITTRGKLWSGILDRLARPGVKRTLECLPLSLRQRIAANALDHVVADRQPNPATLGAPLKSASAP